MPSKVRILHLPLDRIVLGTGPPPSAGVRCVRARNSPCRVTRRAAVASYGGPVALRVVFADDNHLVREGVAGLLAATAEVDLVAAVADPEGLRAAVEAHGRTPCSPTSGCRRPSPPRASTPPSGSGPSYPETGVVVLSQYVEEDYAFELLSDGVAGLGYLLKERVAQVDELVRALHDVARGGSALDPKVVEGLLARKTAEPTSPLLGADRARARGAAGAGDRAQQRARPRRRCS